MVVKSRHALRPGSLKEETRVGLDRMETPTKELDERIFVGMVFTPKRFGHHQFFIVFSFKR